MGSVVLPSSAVERLKKLKEARDDQDAVVKKINKFHSRLSETTREKAEKYSDKLWQKLREYYVNAKRLAEQEERLCAQLTAELSALEQSASAGAGAGPGLAPGGRKRTQGVGEGKKAKSKSKSKQEMEILPGGVALPKALAHSLPKKGQGGDRGCPSVAPGEMVAARTSPNDAEKDDWIVVKVLGFDPTSGLYEVVDEEPGDEEEPGPRKYTLEGPCIIPLPKPGQGDASTAHDFPPSSCVLAVYPGTTSLYRATVVVGELPRKSKEDDYFLEFDDDEEEGFDGLPQRRVPFHHVVPLPSGHRQ